MNLKCIGYLFHYLGISVIMISVIYMILNLSNADYFINKWIVSMIAGTSLSLCGTISLLMKKKTDGR